MSLFYELDDVMEEIRKCSYQLDEAIRLLNTIDIYCDEELFALVEESIKKIEDVKKRLF